MSQFCDDQLFSQLLTQVHMADPVEVNAVLRHHSMYLYLYIVRCISVLLRSNYV